MKGSVADPHELKRRQTVLYFLRDVAGAIQNVAARTPDGGVIVNY
jgi:hypothetical protein